MLSRLVSTSARLSSGQSGKWRKLDLLDKGKTLDALDAMVRETADDKAVGVGRSTRLNLKLQRLDSARNSDSARN